MASSRSTLNGFIDAAADSVARAIAAVKNEAQREQELRKAQFALRLAELDARIASVTDLERRLAERLAAIKDGSNGTSVTLDDVLPALSAQIERALSDWDRPKDGTSVEPEAVRAMVDEAVARSVALIPVPRDGKDIDPADIERMIADAVAKIPAPQDGTSVTVADVEPMLKGMVDAAVSQIPVPRDGTDVDPADIERMVSDAVAKIPVPRDGTSVTVADVEPMLKGMVDAAVSQIPVPRDGKDADPADIERMISAAVAALPKPKDGVDGKDADPETVAALVDDKVRAAVAALPPAKKGEPGPAGSLPVVEDWQDKVYYQGAVVTKDGSTFQAVRDTGKAPGHEDWRCIARHGRDGNDGRSFNVRGTWSADADYCALDVVVLNGASFTAKRDNPGPCPGDGWQLSSMQGKPGKPGLPGRKGDQGPAGTVLAMGVSDQGVLSLVNSDGTEVTCDLYPILSNL